MRLATKIFIVVIFTLAMSATVYADVERHLSRHHTIEIEVECIETARAVINELNGYNLDSNASFTDVRRSAIYTRRVDAWAFRHVQQVLRELGEVQSESENAQYCGTEIMDIDTRILVLSQEMERLSLMMAASRSLDVMIAVNDRLSQVSRDRDHFIGRRNVIAAQVDSPIINIHIYEIPEVPPEDEMSFGSRVVRSFLNSWEVTRTIGEHLFVLLARISVPFTVMAVIVGVILYAALKPRRKKEVVTQEQEVVENEE
ncbi:MAG: DUF4349 domain-containing protein [Clostridiales bacterium]|jgi:hypothetical protein|nr:DUF4349 domain-containing protein [Clostridiales bacterium]